MFYKNQLLQFFMAFQKSIQNLAGISLLGMLFMAASCRQVELFEKNIPIPGYEWSAGFPAKGTFEVTDTLAAYNIYLVLRHTDKYEYNNIWLDVGLQAPGDSLSLQKVDLLLGSDATGWEGTGMNDIWEVRKPLALNYKGFKKKGEYQFTIYNIMRNNPLRHIMSVGLRVEKVADTPKN